MSRLGIVPANASPEGAAGVPEFVAAKPLRAKRDMVSLTFASWNLICSCLRRIDAVRSAA